MTLNTAASVTAAHKHVRTATLEVAYEESGSAGGAPVAAAARLAVRSALLRRRGAAARRRRLPRHRALSARLWRDALSLRRYAALGPAGGARQRFARIARRARHRTRGAGRLRLGRPGRLRGRGAVAGARARPGHRQRLQHPEHRGFGEAGGAGAGASLLVSILFPHRARPRRARAEPPRARAATSGRSGRRTGRSTTPPTRTAPPRSTIPISSR